VLAPLVGAGTDRTVRPVHRCPGAWCSRAWCRGRRRRAARRPGRGPRRGRHANAAAPAEL
jgi:hypothetical protein